MSLGPTLTILNNGNMSFPIISTDEFSRLKRSPYLEMNLPDGFSWESIFPSTQNKRSKRKKRIRKKMLASSSDSYKIAKTTPKPSAIFFPTNEEDGCGESTAVGSGFNTFGFLAMMIAAFNAVNLVASNNNNRRNNNNNNNNDMNDNNNQINEGNTMGDIMEPNNMVNIPPLPGRQLIAKRQAPEYSNKHQAFAQVIKSMVWLQISKKNCYRRALCELNQELKRIDFEALALVASVALIQNMNSVDSGDLMKAGRTGRLSRYACGNIFIAECSNQEWRDIQDKAKNILWK